MLFAKGCDLGVRPVGCVLMNVDCRRTLLGIVLLMQVFSGTIGAAHHKTWSDERVESSHGLVGVSVRLDSVELEHDCVLCHVLAQVVVVELGTSSEWIIAGSWFGLLAATNVEERPRYTELWARPPPRA